MDEPTQTITQQQQAGQGKKTSRVKNVIKFLAFSSILVVIFLLIRKPLSEWLSSTKESEANQPTQQTSTTQSFSERITEITEGKTVTYTPFIQVAGNIVYQEEQQVIIDDLWIDETGDTITGDLIFQNSNINIDGNSIITTNTTISSDELEILDNGISIDEILGDIDLGDVDFDAWEDLSDDGYVTSNLLGTAYFDAYADLSYSGRLDNNYGSDLLTRDQSDTRFVNEGQVNSITSLMIVDSSILNADIASGANISWSKISKSGSLIGDLGDVTSSSPSSGEVLKWNGSRWAPSSDSTGGDADTLDGLNSTAFLRSNANDSYTAGNTLTFAGDTDFNGDMTLSDQTIVLDSASFSAFDLTGNLRILATNDNDDFIYFNTAADAAMMLWDGYTANDPGFRINTATDELEYRDENAAGWTSLDSLAGGSSLWTDLGSELTPGGGEDVQLGDGDWIGVGSGANQPYLTFDDSNDYFEFMGGNVGIGNQTPGELLDVSYNISLGSGAANDDDYLYFDAENESLLWDDTVDSRFEFSDDLFADTFLTSTLTIHDDYIRDSANINLQADSDSSNFFYISTGTEVATETVSALYWDGILAYADDPGLSINDSGEIVYRDENEAGWTSLDSLAGGASLWTDLGTEVTPAGDESVQLDDGDWIGVGSGANQPFITFDDTNNYFELMGGNVGIGDSTPNAILEVRTASTTDGIYVTTAGDYGILSIASDPSGYGVYGQGVWAGVSGSGTSIGTHGVSSAGTGVYGETTSGTALSGQSATGTGLYVNLTGAGTAIASFADNGGEVVTIDDGGYVGIGITIPNYILDIVPGSSTRAINTVYTNPSSASYSLYNTLNTGTASVYGTYNDFTIDNTGNPYGVYNNLTFSGGASTNADVFGFYNNITTTTEESYVYGLYNAFSNTAGVNGSAFYGVYNVGDWDASAADIIGLHNQFGTPSGSELIAGVNNFGLTTDGAWVYGVRNHGFNYTGTGDMHGIYNDLEAANDASAQNLFGIETELELGLGGDIAYGMIVTDKDSTGGTVYGTYIDIDDADSTNYSVYVNAGSGVSYFGSSVGIGITNPGQELEVNGDIRLDANESATTNGLCHSGVNSDTTFADRDIVACSGAPGDIAEWYDTRNGGKGDIVSTTGETITYKSPAVNARTGVILNKKETLTAVVLEKTSHPYQPNVLGVISTSPFETFGKGIIEEAQNPNPVALTGRVPVKVSTLNGSIKPGDPITTSSIPGVGMKATEPGVIIGRALDHYHHPSQIGKILIFVNVSWFEPETFRDKLIQMLEEYTDGNLIGTLDTSDSFESITVSQSLTAMEGNFSSILVENATVSQDLRVEGILTSSQIQTEVISAYDNKDLIIKLSEHIGDTALMIQNSLGEIVFQVNSTGKLSIKDSGDNASIGSGIIDTDQTQVTIKTDAVTKSSKVFITPIGEHLEPPYIWISKKEDGYFVVQSKESLNQQIKFDWWVVN